MKQSGHAGLSDEQSDRPRLAGSARPIDVAIVGGGKMAQQHAMAVARADVPAAVVAFAEPQPASAEAMQVISPDARAFSSLTDLLRDCRPDVVHVCTPPVTHEPLGEEALLAGCHVYIEKPFATTEAGAARLLDLADRKGLRAMAGHQLLFERPFQRLMTYLPALRRIVHVESYFSFRHVRHGKMLRADEQLSDVLPHSVGLLVETLRAANSDERAEVVSIEIGAGGTVHALVRSGSLTATLIVTLEGRPVESYLRVVGTNGSVVADFIRGTVQQSIGPGSSGIDKILHPYQASWQLGVGTSVALGRRALQREISYPGLRAAVGSLYRAVAAGPNAPTPWSDRHILDTVAICEAIDAAVSRTGRAQPVTSEPPVGPRVAVTGGTGLLGRATIVELRRRGVSPISISRRQPPPWEWIPGVEYMVHDLSKPLPAGALDRIEAVIHCAAATTGGWDEHKRHSVDATEHIVRAAAAAGVGRLVHVSSMAVLAKPRRGQALDETSPLVADASSAGPYVHGKLVSEQLARRLAIELDLDLRVVRPGAIVDWAVFDPPGRLGRRVGNWFIAVGRPGEEIGVVDLAFAAETLAWIALEERTATSVLNVVDPTLPTRRDLVKRLKRDNPTMKVVWVPRTVIVPILNLAGLVLSLIRSGGVRLQAGEIFGHRSWDTARIAALEERIRQDATGRMQSSVV
jgi:predicted dehydrogenase/nucleoside-diphosphate-sugar epimerase